MYAFSLALPYSSNMSSHKTSPRNTSHMPEKSPLKWPPQMNSFRWQPRGADENHLRRGRIATSELWFQCHKQFENYCQWVVPFKSNISFPLIDGLDWNCLCGGKGTSVSCLRSTTTRNPNPNHQLGLIWEQENLTWETQNQHKSYPANTISGVSTPKTSIGWKKLTKQQGRNGRKNNQGRGPIESFGLNVCGGYGSGKPAFLPGYVGSQWSLKVTENTKRIWEDPGHQSEWSFCLVPLPPPCLHRLIKGVGIRWAILNTWH